MGTLAAPPRSPSILPTNWFSRTVSMVIDVLPVSRMRPDGAPGVTSLSATFVTRGHDTGIGGPAAGSQPGSHGGDPEWRSAGADEGGSRCGGGRAGRTARRTPLAVPLALPPADAVAPRPRHHDAPGPTV